MQIHLYHYLILLLTIQHTNQFHIHPLSIYKLAQLAFIGLSSIYISTCTSIDSILFLIYDHIFFSLNKSEENDDDEPER